MSLNLVYWANGPAGPVAQMASGVPVSSSRVSSFQAWRHFFSISRKIVSSKQIINFPGNSHILEINE